MTLAGIILAGGSSRRMGRIKALLPFGGETFLDRQIRLLEPHCSPVVVVVGEHAAEIEAGRQRPAVTVINPDPDRGMLSSLQCGLSALPERIDAFLFTPVDLPRINEGTVEQLAQAAGSALIVIPRCHGRRGHPVLMDASLRPELLAASGSPRDVVDRHAGQVRYLDVEDAGILVDVDTPEEYAALTS
ncbi:MAG: nucleotidyltransferase family protein [Bryobacterales bacterium]|nr:nucleotidyltransferase family protein [Bryobacterales bacterium]